MTDDGGLDERMAAVVEAVQATHPDQQGACGGLTSCPDCQQMWRKVAGQRGLCMVCGCRHWPWEPHDIDSTDGADTDGGAATNG